MLLLDDVFAELDNARRRALVEVAASAEQVSGDRRGRRRTFPQDWDARRMVIGMRDDDSGRLSEVIG